MNFFAKTIGFLALILGSAAYPVAAQDNKAANDDPMADLNLGDPAKLTGFAGRFDGHLVSLEGTSLKTFDASTLKGVKYWAFYYSASWCPPCREFTPKLVDFYKQFKPQHPNFELIFVNHDEDEDSMVAYMKDDAMSWPAVRFDDIKRVKANQYCGSGIPDLVLVDADGKVLSDSFKGQDYVGPSQVMDDIKSMVPSP